jgi:hypothetical protein
MAEYLAALRPDKNKRGLWSTIPAGNQYGSLIKDVFGKLFLNDHAVDTILHQPILVAAEEVVPDEEKMWRLIDNCWVQNYWSASITPKGAYFCEVSAAFDMLFDGPGGWPVEPGWWRREPVDYAEQKARWCRRCGCAVPLKRRPSVESRDDVSPGNLKRLEPSARPACQGAHRALRRRPRPRLAPRLQLVHVRSPGREGIPRPHRGPAGRARGRTVRLRAAERPGKP